MRSALLVALITGVLAAPAAAEDAVERAATALRSDPAQAVGRRGVYAVVAGRALRGAQFDESGLATGDAARLALEAARAHLGARPYAALDDFIHRVAHARAHSDHHGSAWRPWRLLFRIVGAAVVGARRRL